MLRRTILLGLAPALASAVCALTAVRSPAADKAKPAAQAAAGKADAPEKAEAAARLVDRKMAALNKLDEHVKLLMQIGGRGPSGVEFHYAWSKRRMETEREAARAAKERLAAAEGHLARMKRLEERYQAARGAPVGIDAREKALDGFALEYFVTEAEQWVADAEAAEKQPR
jgi:hypothetical protein